MTQQPKSVILDMNDSIVFLNQLIFQKVDEIAMWKKYLAQAEKDLVALEKIKILLTRKGEPCL
jgi:hypothetical protein